MNSVWICLWHERQRRITLRRSPRLNLSTRAIAFVQRARDKMMPRKTRGSPTAEGTASFLHGQILCRISPSFPSMQHPTGCDPRETAGAAFRRVPWLPTPVVRRHDWPYAGNALCRAAHRIARSPLRTEKARTHGCRNAERSLEQQEDRRDVQRAWELLDREMGQTSDAGWRLGRGDDNRSSRLTHSRNGYMPIFKDAERRQNTKPVPLRRSSQGIAPCFSGL